MAIEFSKGRTLSVFALVMINVIAVDSLRTLPISAEYGFSLVFFYCVAGICFFIPTALVSAELATAWPETGGVYIWVREAFGPRWGFLTIWLQWIYNVVWFPTILAFIAATLAQIINPDLATHRLYLLSSVVVFFWLALLVNWFGMRISSLVSITGAILGTLLPMGFIIFMGFLWLQSGKPLQVQFDWGHFFPDMSTLNSLALFSSVLFGLMGMEMSAVHAGDVADPQRDYPRALLYSTIIILSTLMAASLAIALVVPQSQLSLVSGLLDAFAIFFNAHNMAWMKPIIAFFIILGAVCSVSAWIIGPTRGLLIAMEDSGRFLYLQKRNRYGMPGRILLLQGAIFMVLCSFFILMPTINSSYWILSAMTSELALLMYIFMFSAAITLRYRYPLAARAFCVPGGNKGMWIICSLGILTCVIAGLLGFLPPSQIDVGNVFDYETKLIGGVLALCLPPILLGRGD